MQKAAKTVLVGGPPMLGGVLMALSTIRIEDAQSTLAHNLDRLGLAHPAFLDSGAVDGWAFGVGFAIVAAWILALIWAIRPRQSDREFYREQLLTIYNDVGAHLRQAVNLDADGQVPLAEADYQRLRQVAREWIVPNMGQAAWVKFEAADTPAHDYPWPGEHSLQAVSARNTLIDTLKGHRRNTEALMSNATWDHPVPLRKRKRAHIGDNAAFAVYMGRGPNPRAIAKVADLAVGAVLPWAF